METQDKEKSKGGIPVLMLLPVLILVGLVLAPSTRSLLRSQTTLLVDSRAFADPLRDFGVKNGPMPTVQKWEQSRPAEIVAHSPDDYTLQIAGSLLSGTNTTGGYGSLPTEHYAFFQRRFGDRLTAVSRHFPDHPGPYAHLLRLMAMGTVRVSREGEAGKFRIGATALPDRQIGSAESWAAFDAAAAQGERTDPDNAYFPLMRAVGFFDARRDTEGIAAVLRAEKKSRFEDYSLEEPRSTLTLYQRSYGVDSALLRKSAYVALLMPHYSVLRAAARLTAAKAAQAEREGRSQEGLALRHAMMQCAVHMRERGELLGAMVGDSIFGTQMNFPGGAVESPPPNKVPDEQKYVARRKGYLEYLHRLGQTEEIGWVTREENLNTEVRHLIRAEGQHTDANAPMKRLPGLWTIDMLMLANMLSVLMMCAAAVVLGRVRGGRKWVPAAVLMVFAACVITAFQMQWAESLTQLKIVLDNIDFAESTELTHTGMRMSEIVTRYPGSVHVGEVVLSLGAPVLLLIVVGATGLFRKEAFAAAPARSLQRGALLFTTLLVAAYAMALIATARAEAQANAVLDARTQNAVAYLRHQAESDRKP